MRSRVARGARGKMVAVNPIHFVMALGGGRDRRAGVGGGEGGGGGRGGGAKGVGASAAYRQGASVGGGAARDCRTSEWGGAACAPKQ